MPHAIRCAKLINQFHNKGSQTINKLRLLPEHFYYITQIYFRASPKRVTKSFFFIKNLIFTANWKLFDFDKHYHVKFNFFW